MKTFKLKIKVLMKQACFAALFASCQNFTDVELPSSQLTSDAVFQNKATAEAAMVDIYSKIRDRGLLTGFPSGLSRQLGLYADELQYYGTSGTAQDYFYQNTLLATGPEIAELWNSSYNQIYAANSVIKGISGSVSLSASDSGQLTGEALFVRAMIHFYLVNSFGPIPYVTETDYKKNSSLHKTPENEVYRLIKEDMQQAANLLPVNYAGTDRVRPNKAAAQAMLARICLYMELWEEAANYASAVLNQKELYIWPVPLDLVFLKDSRSTIWQLMPVTAGRNTYEGNINIFTQGPPPSAAISSELLNAFSSKDQRKAQWIKVVTNGSSTWYHPYKYKKQSSTAASVEYSIVLRLSEQYLIRAEARAHYGDLIGAKEDLNRIRNHAGLENTAALTSSEIIDAVLAERRLELFTEHGHRFFDLKRTGRLNSTLSSVKPQWKNTSRQLPLPESELLLNTNLNPQNEGY
ncbi:RagB/SusD family nutrient uptake outer membrane protein [Flavobacterium piscis]|uniref:Starch-binding protein n=1 Tax=Flavobacterium piscis TaxID=1114874 RepID=A0ABX2XGT6_9FLAO|nr:RagB/SusD family nutrient uptake outer membrane protein [Flavobacterium piscis]OCB73181.1 starch-binding protein [Flavobacterium piscis]OXG02814.1 RagB/SusD family nutrient uptake outer membrane protein [Flavobacterium piscis]